MSKASAALALFDALFDHSPSQLASAFNHRGVPPREDWEITELALALSSNEALWAHLSQLPAEDLEFLASLPQPSDSSEAQSAVEALLAVEEHGEIFLLPEVRALLAQHSETSARASMSSGPAKEPEAEADVPGVFGHIEHVESFLEHTRRHRVDANKLSSVASSLGLGGETVEALVNLTLRLGLLQRLGTALAVTASGHEWLYGGAHDKWRSLLERFVAQLPRWWPDELPEPLTAESLRVAAIARFPLVSLQDTEELVEYAGWLGLVRAGQPTMLSRAHTLEDRAHIIDSSMPPDVAQVYPDGPDTLVAPGPLTTEKNTHLRHVGLWLSGELAPRFLISPSTINDALQHGLVPERVREIIATSVSVGMSASLSEMVDDTISRAQSLSVSPLGLGARLHSSTPLTLELVKTDRRLADAGFRTDEEGTVTSSLSVAQVHEVLAREGYPHLVVDEHGDISMWGEGAGRAERLTAPRWDVESVTQWQNRQRAMRAEPGFFDPALELAISDRAPIRVTVSMGEQTQTMVIEPHAFKNGRLRGRDVRSDVERTLPASHVVSISSGSTFSQET